MATPSSTTYDDAAVHVRAGRCAPVGRHPARAARPAPRPPRRRGRRCAAHPPQHRLVPDRRSALRQRAERQLRLLGWASLRATRTSRSPPQRGRDLGRDDDAAAGRARAPSVPGQSQRRTARAEPATGVGAVAESVRGAAAAHPSMLERWSGPRSLRACRPCRSPTRIRRRRRRRRPGARAGSLRGLRRGRERRRGRARRADGARLIVPGRRRCRRRPQSDPDGLVQDKTVEMALPVMVGTDGRRALPAFTVARGAGRLGPGRPAGAGAGPARGAGRACRRAARSWSSTRPVPVTWVADRAQVESLAGASAPDRLAVDPRGHASPQACAGSAAGPIRSAGAPPGCDARLTVARPTRSPSTCSAWRPRRRTADGESAAVVRRRARGSGEGDARGLAVPRGCAGSLAADPPGSFGARVRKWRPPPTRIDQQARPQHHHGRRVPVRTSGPAVLVTRCPERDDTIPLRCWGFRERFGAGAFFAPGPVTSRRLSRRPHQH